MKLRGAVRSLLQAAFAALVLMALTAACGSASSTSLGNDVAAQPTIEVLAEAVTESADASGEAETAVDVTDRSTTPEPAAAPEPSAAPQPPEPVAYDGSFSTTIQPILEDKCSSCHYDGGPGAFHWNLRTAQDVVETHLLVADVITSNYMPPWPASDLSVGFKADRSLSPDQVQAIVDWVDDGAPIDTEPTTSIEAAAGVVGLQNPDLVIEPSEPYAGDASRRDDHRCLIYDPELDEGGWLTGYEFLPDQKAVVHHAVGFLASAGHEQRVQSLAEEDDKPGWYCAGAHGLLGLTHVFGWAPGQDAIVHREGTGQRIPPDSFFVVQIHYHYDGEAPPDRSALALTVVPPDADLEEIRIRAFAAPAEIPCAEWESGPLCDRDAAYADAVARFGASGVPTNVINHGCGVTPADYAQFTEGVAQSSCTISARSLGRDVEFDGMLLHMHEIGAWTRLTLNKDTADELILLDIPDWDFDWQYTYVPTEPIGLENDDTITLECGWDRARGRSDLEPAWILWAEGTTDEMCISYLTLR